MDIPEFNIKKFESFEEMAKALNDHFPAVVLEKHPNVMAKVIIDRSVEKIFKNYNKERPSQKKIDQFRDSIINELRRYYGEWINLYNLDTKFRGTTNFESVYKTDKGRLFGHYPGTVHDHIFYTAHCFEQYRDRFDCFKKYPLLVLAYKRFRNTTPTAADILKFWALNAIEYCKTDTCIYANIQSGVIVYERLSRGILIAKTFLLPDMDFPKKGWFRSRAMGMNLDMTTEVQEYCKLMGVEAIDKPIFDDYDHSYKFYSKVMEIQKRSNVLDI